MGSALRSAAGEWRRGSRIPRRWRRRLVDSSVYSLKLGSSGDADHRGRCRAGWFARWPLQRIRTSTAASADQCGPPPIKMFSLERWATHPSARIRWPGSRPSSVCAKRWVLTIFAEWPCAERPKRFSRRHGAIPHSARSRWFNARKASSSRSALPSPPPRPRPRRTKYAHAGEIRHRNASHAFSRDRRAFLTEEAPRSHPNAA